MKAHLIFPDVVEFFQDSTWPIKVKNGVTFTMLLREMPEGFVPVLASTRDHVLRIVEPEQPQPGTDGPYHIMAAEAGVSELQVQDHERKVHFWLTVTVESDEAAILEVGAPKTELLQ